MLVDSGKMPRRFNIYAYFIMNHGYSPTSGIERPQKSITDNVTLKDLGDLGFHVFWGAAWASTQLNPERLAEYFSGEGTKDYHTEQYRTNWEFYLMSGKRPEVEEAMLGIIKGPPILGRTVRNMQSNNPSEMLMYLYTSIYKYENLPNRISFGRNLDKFWHFDKNYKVPIPPDMLSLS